MVRRPGPTWNGDPRCPKNLVVGVLPFRPEIVGGSSIPWTDPTNRCLVSRKAHDADRHATRDSAYHGHMCGRAYETYTEEELAFQYLNRRPLRLEGFRPTYNLAPTQPSPVVVVRDGERTIELFQWGLVPSWAKSVAAAAKYSLINARAGEEIAEKRSYAQPFRQLRPGVDMLEGLAKALKVKVTDLLK